MDRCSAGAVVNIPVMVSHHSRSNPILSPRLLTCSCCSRNVSSISDSNSERKSNGNRRSRALYILCENGGWLALILRIRKLGGLQLRQQVLVPSRGNQLLHPCRLLHQYLTSQGGQMVVTAALVVLFRRRTVPAFE